MIKYIYLDTTIPSLATNRTSRDLVNAGRQYLTLFFWENLRQNFNLFISSYVLEECKLGDPDAAHRRVKFLDGISIIPDSDQIQILAAKYLELLDIPEKAKTDCSHLAASVYAKMDCLLSWNLKHFSITTYAKILKFNDKHSLKTPLLLTPAMLIAISQP